MSTGRRWGNRAAAWAVLLLAGLLEIAWALALKQANGLDRPAWAVGGILLAMTSLGMLAYALKNLPVGTAYMNPVIHPLVKRTAPTKRIV